MRVSACGTGFVQQDTMCPPDPPHAPPVITAPILSEGGATPAGQQVFPPAVPSMLFHVREGVQSQREGAPEVKSIPPPAHVNCTLSRNPEQLAPAHESDTVIVEAHAVMVPPHVVPFHTSVTCTPAPSPITPATLVRRRQSDFGIPAGQQEVMTVPPPPEHPPTVTVKSMCAGVFPVGVQHPPAIPVYVAVYGGPHVPDVGSER